VSRNDERCLCHDAPPQLRLLRPARQRRAGEADQIDQALANHDLGQYLSFMDLMSYVDIDTRGHCTGFVQYRSDVQQLFQRQRRIDGHTYVRDVQLVSVIGTRNVWR
jgi:hypothetical protein